MRTHNLLMLTSVAVALSGCNMAERLSNIGEPPELSRIQDPTLAQGYQPVTMPMPRGEAAPRKVNSLWESGSRAFFKDQRANKVGDIITIEVKRKNTGTITSSADNNRETKLNAGITNLYGMEGKNRLWPRTATGVSLFNTLSKPEMKGNGNLTNTDDLDLKVAGTIIQVLPNGNMVVEGRQEIRQASEVREVHVKGIIRREDITSGNIISLDKIAEARVSYGGRGDITDMQSTPWGVQALTRVMPW
jgi:flagellar L-ring protein FlgH